MSFILLFVVLLCEILPSTCPSVMVRSLCLKDGSLVEITMAKCILSITTARKQLGSILETGLSVFSYFIVSILLPVCDDAETCSRSQDANMTAN